MFQLSFREHKSCYLNQVLPVQLGMYVPETLFALQRQKVKIEKRILLMFLYTFLNNGQPYISQLLRTTDTIPKDIFFAARKKN